MKIRSSVSADISQHVIWVNSSDLVSTVKAVKIHEILINDFGYTDALMLEENRTGSGASIAVCDNNVTVRQMRSDYSDAKKQELKTVTTDKHNALAAEFLEHLYSNLK
ncbi:conserved hypothetical protein [Vibrio nigripulchritudo SOn1]|uniref:Uncharacterized protein n=1 Tax=Vibrio nigripulchritudo SOn1 TaxID=1238450 RepID=A0AAV2VI54_9VIBR|nr:hypothetical protein [Vibrio nigripulchritudo]CCO44211.1 conserved hypothetical protein [Vibrio nigripulchritudo SOn1]